MVWARVARHNELTTFLICMCVVMAERFYVAYMSRVKVTLSVYERKLILRLTELDKVRDQQKCDKGLTSKKVNKIN